MINVKDVPYLFDIKETPLRSLPVRYNLEAEHVSDSISVINLEIPINIDVITEQQIMFRNHRYIIAETEVIKSTQRTRVVGESLYVEFNDKNVDILDMKSKTVAEIAQKILGGSGWDFGYADHDGKAHSFLEENQSALYLLRQLARISGLMLDFDTLNRKVNYVNTKGKDLDFIFRYKKNIQEIKKQTFLPKVTVIKPIGKGGLTIENVNDGLDYVEDFSWYTSLGLTIAEARKRFSKKHTWEDDRYIYAGNLMREAQLKLRELAHPQIAYETTVFHIGGDIEIDDYGFVVDDELGIKVKVKIVRLVEYDDKQKNVVELNYMVPGAETTGSTSTGGSESTSSLMISRNETEITVSDYEVTLLEMNITAFNSTNAQVGLNIVGEASQQSLLEGYFRLNANKNREIKQVLMKGYNTIGFPFIMEQIQEGSHTLSFILKNNTGNFKVKKNEAEMFIVAENLLGGLSTKLPRANVLEEVKFIPPIHVIDQVSFTTQRPITIDVGEEVEFIDYIDVVDRVKPAIINRGSLTPEMLSNDKPDPFYIYADTSDADHQPYLAMDKWMTTYWQSTSENSRLTIDLGDEKQADYYVLVMEDVEVSWQLVASNDEVDWITLDENSYDFAEKEEVRFDVDEADNYRYYRLVFDNDEPLRVYEYDLLSEVLLANE